MFFRHHPRPFKILQVDLSLQTTHAAISIAHFRVAYYQIQLIKVHAVVEHCYESSKQRVIVFSVDTDRTRNREKGKDLYT